MNGGLSVAPCCIGQDAPRVGRHHRPARQVSTATAWPAAHGSRPASVRRSAACDSQHYVNFQLLDMYTNTIADVGVLTGGGHGGTYAFVGPGRHGTIPKGAVRIDVPTPDAWLLGRTQVKGPLTSLRQWSWKRSTRSLRCPATARGRPAGQALSPVRHRHYRHRRRSGS